MCRQCLKAGVLLTWALGLPGATGMAIAADKDPTVPPPAWLAAQPVPAGTVVQEPGAADASRVNVVVVGKTRRLALVDGQVVQPGDMVGDTRVTAITGGKVLMVDEEKSLGMTPNVEKKPPAPVVFRKKVVIPEGGVPSQQTGSKQ